MNDVRCLRPTKRYYQQRDLTIILSIIIICSLMCVTFARNVIWNDEVTLARNIVNNSPRKPRGYVILLLAKNASDDAIQRYRDDLKLNPSDALAHHNLGDAYNARGLHLKAIEQYQAALALTPDNYVTHMNLGNVYDFLGQTDKAIEHYHVALNLRPDSPEVHYNLAMAYENKGLTPQAREHYQIALKIHPAYVSAAMRLSQLHH